MDPHAIAMPLHPDLGGFILGALNGSLRPRLDGIPPVHRPHGQNYDNTRASSRLEPNQTYLVMVQRGLTVCH